MAYEDFTDYTEVDTVNDRIQKTANHCDHRATRNESTYLYDDKGVDNFGDFEHLVDIRLTYEDDTCLGALWFISDFVGNLKAHIDATEEYCSINFYRSDATSGKTFSLAHRSAVANNSDAYTALANTWYYLTIRRVGTTLTCDVYSDSGRTVGLATLTVECSNTPYRYIYVCNSYNDAQANRDTDNDIDNLDLREVRTPTESLVITRDIHIGGI